MADGAGVTNAPPTHTTKPQTPQEKKRKLLLVAGAGIGGVLLLAHHGSSSNTSGSTDSTQQQADALAAEEAAMLSPQIPGGFAPGDSGGGGGFDTTTGTNGTPASPSGGTIINVNVPRGAGTPAKKHRRVTQHGAGKKAPHPKGGSHGKPKPAKSKGKHAGKHPTTHHRTAHGHHRNSPAVVESIFGAGSGTVVMGRRFPGAIAHRLGPPRRQTDGTVARTVTVDYGGYTETHLAHNNGERWTDRAPGMNPPSRGVPVNNGRVPV